MVKGIVARRGVAPVIDNAVCRRVCLAGGQMLQAVIVARIRLVYIAPGTDILNLDVIGVIA